MILRQLSKCYKKLVNYINYSIRCHGLARRAAHMVRQIDMSPVYGIKWNHVKSPYLTLSLSIKSAQMAVQTLRDRYIDMCKDMPHQYVHTIRHKCTAYGIESYVCITNRHISAHIDKPIFRILRLPNGNCIYIYSIIYCVSIRIWRRLLQMFEKNGNYLKSDIENANHGGYIPVFMDEIATAIIRAYVTMTFKEF